MRGILAQRNAREISGQAPIPGISDILPYAPHIVYSTAYCKAVVKRQTSESVLYPCFDLALMLWSCFDNDALIMRSGGGRTIWKWNAYICRRASRDYPRSLMLFLGLLRFDIHCKIRLQDTALLEFSWKLWIPLKSPLSESALSIVYFLPSIPSPQIQRDRCFEHIKAKEVYIIPRNSIVNNILFTFSIVQNAKLYYRKRLKANIQTCKSSFARKPGIPKHIHIYRQNIAYKRWAEFCARPSYGDMGGISICLKLPYGPKNTVNIAGTIA